MNKLKIRLFIRRYMKYPNRSKKKLYSWAVIKETVYFDYSISRIKYE